MIPDKATETKFTADNLRLLYPAPANEESLYSVLTKWSVVTSEYGKAISSKKDAKEGHQEMIELSAILKQKSKEFFIQSIVGKIAVQDKRELTSITQSIITRLLDQVFVVEQKQTEETCLESIKLVSEHVKEVFEFIREYFSSYFDYTQRVPGYLLVQFKESLKTSAESLKQLVVNNGIEMEEIGVVVAEIIEHTIGEKSAINTYRQINYYKDLFHQFLSGDGTINSSFIRHAFYKLNYNSETFIINEYERLNKACSQLYSIKEKIAFLSYELKKVNQFFCTPRNSYQPFLPSVKEQVGNWIVEEIRFLEKGTLPVEYTNTLSEPDSKIHTSLSVAKLAVIIRLLVVDKIIINRTVAPMLRIVGRTFSTLQKDDISIGSLETKYHAPDKTTINAVRDMLFKWINILGKL
ncbi:MAG: hypothetical protein J0H85_03035 [Sediminibacterium magnilacihabitans]|jgi:hypothetical protein|nr:hypothetical protein [Sediminibacterium magnilacihabitans]PQV62142.1 hypothetical protein CLV53_101417 [Sediminibacterium magnilacihabitans]